MVVTVLRLLVVAHLARSLHQLWQLRKGAVSVEDHGTHGVLRGVRLEEGVGPPLL